MKNIEHDNDSNSYQDNVLYLEKLSEKYHASLVFLNLGEVNKINSITEEFITGCLKKKKEKMINLKKSRINKGSTYTDQLEKIHDSMSIDENNSSPKKNKIGNCLIFWDKSFYWLNLCKKFGKKYLKLIFVSKFNLNSSLIVYYSKNTETKRYLFLKNNTIVIY